MFLSWWNNKFRMCIFKGVILQYLSYLQRYLQKTKRSILNSRKAVSAILPVPQPRSSQLIFSLKQQWRISEICLLKILHNKWKSSSDFFCHIYRAKRGIVNAHTANLLSIYTNNASKIFWVSSLIFLTTELTDNIDGFPFLSKRNPFSLLLLGPKRNSSSNSFGIWRDSMVEPLVLSLPISHSS